MIVDLLAVGIQAIYPRTAISGRGVEITLLRVQAEMTEKSAASPCL